MLTALASLLLWSFLAATVLTLSTEAPLIIFVRTYQQMTVPVLMATAGNYFGACIMYWLARRTIQAFANEHERASRHPGGQALAAFRSSLVLS